MTAIDTDVLVLGAGAAGLVTALSASGRRVGLLQAQGCASELAQGGIAAAVGADDTPQLHAADTHAAGHGRNNDDAVRIACHGAPGAIDWLESLGVRFARAGAGWSLHLEAAHSRARVLHAGGDATGAELMRVLRQQVDQAPHIEQLAGLRATGLLRCDDGIRGVTALSADGQSFTVHARDVVIATGGIGALYSRTTNPASARGDGVAMALAAGARCTHLASVQFHPTALDVPARPLPLLTEALRGAGARLLDEGGAPLMQATHPLGDLAPRDVVARRVHREQVQGGSVWLDATALEDTEVAQSFPSAYRACRQHGIDPHRERIRVTCAAHYHMGGLAVDLDGRTSLPRLWAVGEAACTGLHGTNRLASNSLLEAVVFGRRLGRALERHGGTPGPRGVATDASCDEGVDDALRDLMWQCLGPARDPAAIAGGLATLSGWRSSQGARTAPPPRLGLVAAMLREAAECTP
ncbi:MAG: L-aspartate oxidase [Steroidobacteraceae bacterium]